MKPKKSEEEAARATLRQAVEDHSGKLRSIAFAMDGVIKGLGPFNRGQARVLEQCRLAVVSASEELSKAVNDTDLDLAEISGLQKMAGQIALFSAKVVCRTALTVVTAHTVTDLITRAEETVEHGCVVEAAISSFSAATEPIDKATGPGEPRWMPGDRTGARVPESLQGRFPPESVDATIKSLLDDNLSESMEAITDLGGQLGGHLGD